MHEDEARSRGVSASALLPQDAFLAVDGVKVGSCNAIVRFLAATGGAQGEAIYPRSKPLAAALVDSWLDRAHALGVSAASWMLPGAAAASDEERSASKGSVEAQLAALDAHLSESPFLAGATLSLADIVAASIIKVCTRGPDLAHRSIGRSNCGPYLPDSTEYVRRRAG